jgi:hypothetical protein
VCMRTLLKVGRHLRRICVERDEPRRVVGLIPRPQETCLTLLERWLLFWVYGLGLAVIDGPRDSRGGSTST